MSYRRNPAGDVDCEVLGWSGTGELVQLGGHGRTAGVYAAYHLSLLASLREDPLDRHGKLLGLVAMGTFGVVSCVL